MIKNVVAFMISSRSMGVVVGIASILSIFVAGCLPNKEELKQTYQWSAYMIESSRITTSNEFVKENSINLINAQPNVDPYVLGALSIKETYASLNQLSDAIVTQLTRELRKRKITVRPDASKSMEIKVVSTNFDRGMWASQASMNVHLQTGKNYVKDILIENMAPMSTVENAFDGAVALAVIEILNNSEIVSYLQE